MNSTLRLFDLQQGKGLIKVNGQPLSLVQPEILRFKVRYSITAHPNTTAATTTNGTILQETEMNTRR
jgi:ribosomal protein S9